MTDLTPIMVSRPDLNDGMEWEGGAFGDDTAPGWQVVPYSSTRNWPCNLDDADSLLIRAAQNMPVDGAGHISFAEARRMGALLIALADHGERRAVGGGDRG